MFCWILEFRMNFSKRLVEVGLVIQSGWFETFIKYMQTKMFFGLYIIYRYELVAPKSVIHSRVERITVNIFRRSCPLNNVSQLRSYLFFKLNRMRIQQIA